MRKLISILVCLVVTAGASAQDTDSERMFMAAWNEYLAAAETGDHGRIIDSLRVVLDVAQHTLPPDDERLPIVWMNFGTALANSGDWVAARPYQEHAYELAVEAFGEDSEKMVPVLQSYADSRAVPGKSNQQEKYYKQALRIVGRGHGKDSLEYAALAHRAGSRVFALSGTIGGRAFLEDAYEIFARQLGADSEEAALSAYYLGRIERMRGKDKSAIEYFQLALDGLADDPQSQNLVRVQLFVMLENFGRSDEAIEQLHAIAARPTFDDSAGRRPLYRSSVTDPRPWDERDTLETVELEFTIDEDGRVRDVATVSSTGGDKFSLAATHSIVKWRYVPTMADGVIVPTENVRATIQFPPRTGIQGPRPPDVEDLPSIPGYE